MLPEYMQFNGKYWMLAKGTQIYLTKGRTVAGSSRSGLQCTLADSNMCLCVFCLSLLQNEKETEQLKSLERSFY